MSKLSIIVTCLILCSYSVSAYDRSGVYDSTDARSVKAAIEKIWIAAKQYNMDRGAWPKTTDDLVSTNYLDLDSVISRQWRFRIGLGYPYTISASSTDSVELFDPLPQWVSKYQVNYDILTGLWEGSGIPSHSGDTLAIEEHAGLVIEAKAVMELIWFHAKVYYEDRGLWPPTVEEMISTRYILVDPGVVAQWKFGIIGSPPENIIAISTDIMPAGAGHALEFDVNTETWKGFGIK